jgi:hypothetical protein
MRLRSKRAVAAVALWSLPTAAYADDVEQAFKMGEAAKNAGIAIDYSVSGWHSYIDLNISSMLPGDARDVADSGCILARSLRWEHPWTIRVFLVVGERPAAQCTFR